MKRHNEFEQNSEEWFEFRKKRIGGTRLKGLWAAKAWTKESLVAAFDKFKIDYPKTVPRDPKAKPGPKESVADLEKRLTPEVRMYLLGQAEKKIEFYELLADHLGIEPDEEEDKPEFEDVRDRGHRLEDIAAQKFVEVTGKKVQTVGCWTHSEDDRIFNSPDREVVPLKGKKIVEAVEIKCLSRARHLQAIVENIIPDEFESQKVQYFVVNPDLQKLYFTFYDPRVIARPFHVIEITRESLGNRPQEYFEFQKVQLADIDRLVEELSW